MVKKLAVLWAVLGMVAVPMSAAASQPSRTTAPVTLTDGELDEVVGGHHGSHSSHHSGGGGTKIFGPLISVTLKDVTLLVNIQNSNVNLAAVLQLALFSTAIQNGSASALQMAVGH